MKYINKIKFIPSRSLIILLAGWLALASGAVLAHGHEKPPVTTASSAAIGGDFALTDQHGKPVKDAEFRGKLMLVFFGFTHCPDICPVTVATMSKLMPLLGDKAKDVAPIFITVDPKRDTQKALKDYLANFDQRIIALTGAPKDIKKAADAYKVYFSLAEASKDKKGDYQVDHSTIVYLMGKDGAYIRHFSYNAGEQEIATAITEVLK